MTSIVALAGLAGCGTEQPTGGSTAPRAAGTTPAGSQDSDGTYVGRGMVIEYADKAPQLCMGAIGDSYPPSCDGPEVEGWDWSAVDDETSANGATWGSYTVTGTYDGKRFTLTEPAGPPTDSPTDDPLDSLKTPCDPPSGGWKVIDPDTTTDDALAAANQVAQDLDGYAQLWVDASTNPAYTDDGAMSEEQAMQLNDPTKLVLNVSLTGDTDAAETAIRAVWGGALCVSKAKHSAAELQAIADQIMSRTDILTLGPDAIAGNVQVSVIVDDGLQAWADETFGEGMVVVDSALQPAS